MRGYLQRLVATANGAESSVQPLVRPVFAPPAPDAPDQLAPALLRDNPGAPDHFKQSFASDYDSRSEELIVADPLDDTGREAPSRRRPAHVNEFEPLLPTDIRKPALVEMSAMPHGRRSPEPEPLTPHDRPEMAAEQTRARNANISDYVPLLETRRTALQREPVASEMQHHKQTRLKQEQLGQQPASAPTTDEIHIHIGRIEVTAVPLPVRPTSQKPANSGPSLQDYLKRRDRRLQ